MAIDQRYKELIQTLDLSDAAFARAIGITRSSVSLMLKGKTKPSIDTLISTLRKFPKVNARWLILDEGEMYSTELSELSQVNEPAGNYNSDVIKTLKIQLEKKDEHLTESMKQNTILLGMLNKNDDG